ncbi:MAG: trigger factor [Candidatus Carbobacillus altaicus]|nr:trigger factor [Candidatus Carbobacillus altaicus]
MRTTLETVDKHKVAVTVEIDAETFDAALDRAFRKVVRSVSVPGFRKGRVPRPIFERRFGVESLYEEALEELLPTTYEAAIEQEGVEPVERPKFEVTQIEKGLPLIYKATVTVRPEVKLDLAIEQLTVTREVQNVREEDVEKRLEEMRKDAALLVPVEDEEATVEEGDTLTIDYEGFIDGEPFEGGSAEGATLEIGSGRFIPGFEEGLIGKKLGQEATIEVKFPDDYHAEKLAGKMATFVVMIHEIKRKEYPALDDDFAREVSDVDSLEALKAEVREELEKEAQLSADRAVEKKLVDELVRYASVDLPDEMVHHEAHDMVHELEHNLRAYGIPMELYYQSVQKDHDQLLEEFKPEARRRLTERLALLALAKKEGLTVSEEELNEEISRYAETERVDVAEMKARLEQYGAMGSLRESILVRKALDWLKTHAKIETVFVDAEETSDTAREAGEGAQVSPEGNVQTLEGNIKRAVDDAAASGNGDGIHIAQDDHA